MRSRKFDDYLDEDEFYRHYDAAYGHLESRIREDAVISVCWLVGTFLNYTLVPVFKPERIWDEITEHAGRYCTWIGVNPMNPQKIEKRGSKTDVLTVANLIVEFDTEDGYHKPSAAKKGEEPKPMLTRAQALESIATLNEKFEPSVVSNSGGGFHVWLSVEDDLDPNSPLIPRWKAYADSLGGDASVSGDIARIMRPAGTVNHKLRNALAAYGDSWGDGTRLHEGRDSDGSPTWNGRLVSTAPSLVTIIDELSKGV